MQISYDPAKNERNIAERGLPFDLVAALDWSLAVIRQDDRRDYGEIRLRVSAPLAGRLHMAIVTWRGETLHVISLRKANRKEIQQHAEAASHSP